MKEYKYTNKEENPFQNIGMVILLGILMNCLKPHNAV